MRSWVPVETERPLADSGLKWDDRGLIPAVVQDSQSGEVLMVAWMNPESLSRTLADRRTWFWSRSRGELWAKGATSGHVQHVEEVRTDCDADTLLVLVHQEGAACHTGNRSCFYRRLEPDGGTGAANGTAGTAIGGTGTGGTAGPAGTGERER